jgi:hypothetical protein
MDNRVSLSIDTPEPGVLVFVLTDSQGHAINRVECVFSGHVDNLVLTTVDNLLKESSVDRFALKAVELGSGIDKSSSLYRIVQSFAAAVAAAR